MNTQTEQFCREICLSDSAKKLLEERHINTETMISHSIGFCPANTNYTFDFLNGRLIIPICDQYGTEVAYAGRIIEHYSTSVKNYYQKNHGSFEGLNKFMKWKQSKWINSPYSKSDFLYNLHHAKKHIFEQNLCFIVEGYFDVLHLVQLGYQNVVALCGVNLSEKQCELLLRYCKRVCFILDGDQAGRKATIAGVKMARSHGLYSSVIQLPEGHDPDQLTKEAMEFFFENIKDLREDEEILLNI